MKEICNYATISSTYKPYKQNKLTLPIALRSTAYNSPYIDSILFIFLDMWY